ncbi:hypothetical protein H6CHR_04599 [Variovorax sp. PBL-H6]|uniref:hypothetical protein n=1 Tax=Variovorax sp. PBL-H6 TaxID=434009 RepID=UPI0013162913|nr:hypothetical protein [Variovorax sp. PBL-H6]VTU36037.1 hypothetical protein H6CHR_04599 [Variovorax sp. PBL-H6]
MIARAWTVSLCLAATSAQAGGHFDVDDAGMLDPGQCQYEFWGTRVRSEHSTVWHLGPACRVGPVELGLNIDRISVPGDTVHVLGPQLKWTFFGTTPEARWSAAVSMGYISQQPRRGGRDGGQFVVPVTWRATESLMVHANLGADWATGSGARTGRGGLAGEWALNDTVSLIAERNRASGLWTSRFGARVSITPLISIDLSAARTGPSGVRSFSVGLNHEFGR